MKFESNVKKLEVIGPTIAGHSKPLTKTDKKNRRRKNCFITENGFS